MSKIGRKPIPVESANVTIDGKMLTIKGLKHTETHILPEGVHIVQEDKCLKITVDENTAELKRAWGLHRALIANKVKGVETGFEQRVKIVGLGLKGQLVGRKINFSLGFSHKIEFDLPEGVSVVVEEKKGQDLLFRAANKELLSNTCDAVRRLRPPEPYKGTGIMFEGQRIIRKAGKTKA